MLPSRPDPGPTALAIAVILLAGISAGQVTTRVSVDSAGAQGNLNSDYPSISADGRFVAFYSSSSNLVPGDTNGILDTFLRDRRTGTTERVSVDSNGVQGNFDSFLSSISDDGRFVAFVSQATNLVPGDTNNARDIFVRDRQSASTARVSVDSNGVQGNGNSRFPILTGDARYVAFYSSATNLVIGDGNGVDDVFVHDRQFARTRRVSTDAAGGEGNGPSQFPAISSDGRFVAFESDATNLVPGDGNGARDVFVKDRQTGAIERASVDSAGAEAAGASYAASISADGRFVAFASDASDLVAGDTNGVADVFVRDRQGGTTVRVSVDGSGAQGNGASATPVLSADTRYVAFASTASDLVAGDTNGVSDVFVHDLQIGSTVRVSVDSARREGNGGSFRAQISADGGRIVFNSAASNLVQGDTNAIPDILFHDRGFVAPPDTSFCFGDGTGAACPCGNSGSAGHGCQNSASTGGASLAAIGTTSPDTVVLLSTGELPNALSIFLQGDASIAPVLFGDGLRCVGGVLKRIAVVSASGGAAVFPSCPPPGITARSAALGDPIAPGSIRHYMAYYRDPSASYCPGPAGGTFNSSQAISITW